MASTTVSSELDREGDSTMLSFGGVDLAEGAAEQFLYIMMMISGSVSAKPMDIAEPSEEKGKVASAADTAATSAFNWYSHLLVLSHEHAGTSSTFSTMDTTADAQAKGVVK